MRLRDWLATAARHALTDQGTCLMRSSGSYPLLLTLFLMCGFTTSLATAQIRKTLPIPNAMDRMPGSATHVAYSPDGRLLAANNRRRELIIWDSDGGELLQRIPFGIRDGARKCLAFSPDGKTIAVGGSDDAGGAIALLDVINGHERKKFAGYPPIAFSPDGTLLAATTNWPRDTVLVYDVSTGDLRAEIKSAMRQIDDLAFAPATNLLAVAAQSDIDNVTLWNPAAKQVVASSKGLLRGVRQIMFTADGQRLLACAQERLHVCDTKSLKARESIRLKYGAVTLALSTNDETLAIIGRDFIDVLNMKDNRLIGTLRGHAFNAAAFSTNGNTLATVGDASGLVLWDWAQLTETIAPTHLVTFSRVDSGKGSMQFTPDSRRLVVRASRTTDQPMRAYFIDVSSGRIGTSISARSSDCGWFYFFDSDAPFAIAKDTHDPHISIDFMDLNTQRYRYSLPVNRAHGTIPIFSRDGKVFATARDEHGGTASIYDAATGTLLQKLQLAGSRGLDAFSPDGDLVVGNFTIWNVATGEQVMSAGRDNCAAGEFTPDGKEIVGLTGGTELIIWNLEDGHVSSPFPLCRNVFNNGGETLGFCLSKDGKFLVTCGIKNTYLWEYGTRTLLATLETGPKGTATVCFSPDNRFVASIGYDRINDNEVRIWDVSRVTVQLHNPN